MLHIIKFNQNLNNVKTSKVGLFDTKKWLIFNIYFNARIGAALIRKTYFW